MLVLNGVQKRVILSYLFTTEVNASQLIKLIEFQMSFVQMCVKLLSGVRNVTFLTFSWMWIGKLVFYPLWTVMKVCEDQKPLTQVHNYSVMCILFTFTMLDSDNKLPW